MGIANIARKRSITVGWSVVGTEPMPSECAASIKFCVAGITELAVPGGTAHANTTHGTSFISSASSLASL